MCENIKDGEFEIVEGNKLKNGKGYKCLNKTRYKELVNLICTIVKSDVGKTGIDLNELKIDEMIEHILYGIRELFDFDPDVKVYSREYGLRQIERKRQEAANQGKSGYELFSKKYRENKKKVS